MHDSGSESDASSILTQPMNHKQPKQDLSDIESQRHYERVAFFAQLKQAALDGTSKITLTHFNKLMLVKMVVLDERCEGWRVREAENAERVVNGEDEIAAPIVAASTDYAALLPLYKEKILVKLAHLMKERHDDLEYVKPVKTNRDFAQRVQKTAAMRKGEKLGKVLKLVNGSKMPQQEKLRVLKQIVVEETTRNNERKRLSDIWKIQNGVEILARVPAVRRELADWMAMMPAYKKRIAKRAAEEILEKIDKSEKRQRVVEDEE